MPNKMLIDATHPEETRVVVVRGNRVEEFDFETAQRKQLRGNIYLAKVTRVEPSLQAAFIEYGGNRHGFLAFSEIHPDYYQIPVADRQALIEADERAHREAEEESENRSSRRRSRHRNSRRRGSGDRVRSEIVEAHDASHESPHESPDDAVAADARDGDAPGRDHPHADHAHEDGAHHHDASPGAHDEPGHPAHDAAPPNAEANSERTGAEIAADRLDEQPPQPASTDDAPALPEAAAPAVQPETHEATAHAAVGDHAPDSPGDAPTLASSEDAAPPAGEPADHHDDHGQDHAHDHPHDHDAAHDEHHDAAQAAHAEDDDEDDDAEDEDDEVESVGGDDVMEEVPERPFRPRRQYKIQEVIKRRQVMLVQVVKEERGNKGAALTTYLSLAGRYAVLMPNTARGGGISRKITSAQDRSRLKEVVQDLDVPEGMGIILRTAGAARTKPEIKRDFEYLIRMWETVRDTTLKSQAPTLVYEEGSLIKRSLRDLFNKEIDEIQVAGDAGYHEARDFMKMLMPTSVRAVKSYRDGQPLFSRMGVESQLDAMFTPTVQLRSGGYIVINQTEALVSIDVNSGRSTREHHIEDTALKTNMEAAEEVARQLRLRDLAGLIVIDFIDMDEKRNNRSVERKLSECLRQDRARIQVGRISHFGLLEMSRQRIRASVLESSTEPCSQCGGTGHVRSVSSVALQLLRSLEEVLMKGATHNLVVRTRTDVALYVLNHKRGHLRDLENGFKVSLSVIADATIHGQQSFLIDRGEMVHTLEAAKALLATQLAAPPAQVDDAEDDDFEVEAEIETEETEGLSEALAGDGAEAAEGDGDGRRRKRRRRRRGRGEGRDADHGEADGRDDGERIADAPRADAEEPGDQAVVAADGDDGANMTAAEARGESTDENGDGERRPRRRGRRGGRRRRGGPEDGLVGSISDELGPQAQSESSEAVADLGDTLAAAPAEEPAPAARDGAPPAPQQVAADDPAAEPDTEKAARRRSTVREKVSFGSPAPAAEPQARPAAPSDAPEAAPASDAAPAADATPDAQPADAGPRKAGWWSRRFGGG